MRKLNYKTDLCVVGGGLAGLSTALAAARHGIQVVLIQEFQHISLLREGVRFIISSSTWVGLLMKLELSRKVFIFGINLAHLIRLSL